MRAGERREHEVADVRMTRMDRQLIAVLGAARRLVDVREIEAGINALRVQIERERHDVDVAGALAVAEQRAFDALGAGHHAELGRRDRGAAIVVRMDRQHDRVALRDVTAEPFDLIRVDVRRRHLDGRRQIEDDLALRASAARPRSRRRRSRPRSRAPCR